MFIIYLTVLDLSCGVQAYLPHSMWDLTSLTRDTTRVLCIGRWILNCWTTGVVPQMLRFYTHKSSVACLSGFCTRMSFYLK